MILNLNSGVPKKYIDEKDAANKALIDAEAQNRSSADQTLQGNINSEATTRKNADDALQALIDDLEENTRGSDPQHTRPLVMRLAMYPSSSRTESWTRPSCPTSPSASSRAPFRPSQD